MPFPFIQRTPPNHLSSVNSVSGSEEIEMVDLEPAAVTQQPSSTETVTQQPHPFRSARATNTREQCSTCCAGVVNNPTVCKMATGALALGAFGTLLGAGGAVMLGGNAAHGAMYGYMAGTGAGLPMGCAVQKCHDMYWEREDTAAIARAEQANAVPEEEFGGKECQGSDGLSSEACGFTNPGYEEEPGEGNNSPIFTVKCEVHNPPAGSPLPTLKFSDGNASGEEVDSD